MLHDIAEQVRHRNHLYHQWGCGRKLFQVRGITALFAGPAGTGKTLAAEVLAFDLKLALHRIDLTKIVSNYIGETEKNLREVLERAEQQNAAVFFDEADALFGKRNELKDAHHRYANIEISPLLQRLEEFTGIAILGTCGSDDLDAAFLRRLDWVVPFCSHGPNRTSVRKKRKRKNE